MKKIILLILSIIILVICAKNIFINCFSLFEKYYINQSLFNKRLFFLLVALLDIVLIVKIIFHLSINKTIKNISLLFSTIILIFGLSEFFMMFKPISNGTGATLASRLWFGYNWRNNEQGFRYFKYLKDNLIYNNTIIAFKGDSFTADHGIKNPDNRVSNIIRKKFRKIYQLKSVL